MRRVCGLLLAGTVAAGASAALAEDVATAFNRTGLALFQEIGGQEGNVVLSPFSIGLAMAMATSGARGTTLDEMGRVLGLPAESGALATAAGALGRAAAQREPGEEAAISVANALHMTRYGDLVAAGYRALLQEAFDAELFEGSDLDAVNGWVAEKTAGRIDRILSDLDPNAVAVLLNAIHFKAPWARPFDADATRPAPFRLNGRDPVDVPTMHRRGSYRIFRAEGFDALALPYKGGMLEMIVLLPKLDDGVVPADVDTISAVQEGLYATAPTTVDLALPKFAIATEADLVSGFGGMGMTLAFDPDRADFTGITESTRPEDRIHISQIRHKAFIDLAESGTEAGAATAVEFAAGSAPNATPPPVFRVDRPFVFLVIDRKTGAILFLGHVADPLGMAG